MYVAATICKAIAKGDKNKFVMKLGAGQGKTLVYLLVCLMLYSSDETSSKYKKFLVMTSIPALFDQLLQVKRYHKIPSMIEFAHSENLFTLDTAQADLYILDEADWLTRTMAVKFNSKHQLQGFYQLIDKKFLLCSATFSNLESEIVEESLGIPSSEWMQFETAPEFSTGLKSLSTHITHDECDSAA